MPSKSYMILGLFLGICLIPFKIFLEVFYFIFRCRPRKDIKNEHILITGAGQGIGAEFARQFAEMGNIVHCVDIDETLVSRVVGELREEGFRSHSYVCDLTQPEAVQELFDKISQSGAVVSVLVNNAGVAFGKEITELTLTQINYSLTVNLVSNLWLIKLFLPGMIQQGRGHVVNMASTAGIHPLRNATDYCTGKAASIQSIHQLDFRYHHDNINFTAICPWWVQTKLIDGLKPIFLITPRELVEHAIVGIRENKELVVVPRWMQFTKLLYDAAPESVLQLWTAATEWVVDARKQARMYVGHKLDQKIK